MAKEEQEKFDKDAFIATQKAKNNGNLELAISVLGGENFSLRGDRRDLAEQVAELKTKLPAEDSVTLSKDEAADYEANKIFFDELKLDRKAIKDKLASLPEIEGKLSAIEKRETFRRVGKALDYKPNVIEKLMANADEYSFDFRNEKDKETDTDVEIPIIKTGDKEQPFEEFVKNEFTDFLPALKVDQKANEHNGGTGANLPDPKPSGLADDLEADKQAKNRMAAATHSAF